MTSTIGQRFLVRGGTAAALATLNEVPLARELVIETDTGQAKQGDGATHYNSLPYVFLGSAEYIRDVIGAALVAGAGIGITVNDAGDTIAIASTITQYTDEMVRDVIGAALVAGAGIGITVNDAGDTITIASTITQYTDEMARDALGAAIVGSTGVSSVVDDAGDTITLRAGAGLPFAVPSGSLYLNAVNGAALSTVASVADVFYAWPIMPLAEDRVISALACYITTGVASAKIRLGIYSDNGGSPDQLLAGGAELDCATSSVQREDTFGASYTLKKGTRYWLCANTNSTATFRSIVTTAGPVLGVVTASTLAGTSPANCKTKTSHTYAALPSTAPAVTLDTRSAIAIGLKQA